MTKDTCSLHCGEFYGVGEEAFSNNKAFLEELFGLVEFDPEQGTLRLCGARGVSDLPSDLTKILDTLSHLPGETGKGRIMLHCERLFEVCYFRHRMWKLEAIGMPEDPFDGVRHA